jgi:TPP-dependent pyruvate/acetoin dehydrogenase alpha subunit
MRDEGSLTDDDLAVREQQIAAEIDDAVAFAEASDFEPVEDLERFIHSAATGGGAP